MTHPPHNLCDLDTTASDQVITPFLTAYLVELDDDLRRLQSRGDRINALNTHLDRWETCRARLKAPATSASTCRFCRASLLEVDAAISAVLARRSDLAAQAQADVLRFGRAS
ncbi:MAG: hypothetical protein U1E62_21555 [Alsobacter sp.]